MKNNDFKTTLHQLYSSELLEILDHPNFDHKKQLIINELKKRYDRIRK